MTHRRKIRIFSSLPMFAGTLCGASLLAGCAGSTAPRTPAEFKQAVPRAVLVNTGAKDIEEWRASGLTPEALSRQAMDSPQPAQALGAMCESLRGLPPESLALFEDQLEDARVVDKGLDCGPALTQRLSVYWQSQRDKLVADSRSGKTETRKAPATLPSLEVHIDPSRGETLFGSRREGYVKEGQIAITLDDGPHPRITREILDILGSRGVRSNFFCVGENSSRWPKLLATEREEGHVVGSHTHDHPNLRKLSLEKAEDQILRGREEAEQALDGDAAPFFRFPYGARTTRLDQFLKEREMASFLWNMDSEDWKRRNPSDLLKHELEEVDRAKGGILLMHDIHEQTAIALPHLLDALAERGFTTVVFIPHI
jgi:peptidoglycan/xylan/chitin deacetylase (PgdA/CDA1 family)